LLGVAGASRERTVADYCYSFGSVEEVDDFIYNNRFAPSDELLLRRAAIEAVYDRLMEAYGSFEGYLGECGVTDDEIARVRAHLLRS
ncbi:MAG: tyrosine-protein phosphatase, partial [Atopobiaceae bacterium]|nr:tyrosine-protein phosphatase [Atopobiaceae bacterium]MBR3318376.1 tyrosine-protein phosphatase [Atopobiaceae bacterium]